MSVNTNTGPELGVKKRVKKMVKISESTNVNLRLVVNIFHRFLRKTLCHEHLIQRSVRIKTYFTSLLLEYE